MKPNENLKKIYQKNLIEKLAVICEGKSERKRQRERERQKKREKTM